VEYSIYRPRYGYIVSDILASEAKTGMGKQVLDICVGACN